MLTREPIRARPDQDALFADLTRGPCRALLDSCLGCEQGRFSFVGDRPFLVMTARGRRVQLLDGEGRRELDADPFDVLRDLLVRYRVTAPPGADAPLAGAAIGYLGYELARHVERLPQTTEDDLGLPDLALMFFDRVASVDHDRGRSEWLHAQVPGVPVGERPALAVELPAAAMPAREGSNMSRERYLAAVHTIKRYIEEGDIFQANLAQRFAARLGVDPWELYGHLRWENPAPFAAYLDFGSFQVLSSSPERFLRVDGRQVETRPIKGTRARADEPGEDRRRARELARSPKDRAELAMIVDLERNDLGRVCEYGSVRVEQAQTVESYAAVHHLVATVRGTLRREADRIDLLRATFPGGSITGAPKIRAMEIIDELEPHVRGPYTGAIGYLGFDGRADLNVAIRTLVHRDGWCCFHVGGGIVADSEPEAEYQETLDKARALIAALRDAGCDLGV
jgi:para-aminobenzoate synthetase component I